MPRTGLSSHQMRCVKGNSNYFEDQIKKDQQDYNRDI